MHHVSVRRAQKSPRGGVGGIAAIHLLVLQAEGEEDVVERGPPEPRLDLGGSALDQDAPAPHEADPVGLVRLLHEVRRDDHGGPGGGAVDEERPA